jgi:fermentation-respiration switch protein FrsA (DUF1100 family)
LKRAGVPSLKRRVLFWAAVIYAVWCGAVYMIQERFIFPRFMIAPATKVIPRGVEQMWIDIGTPSRPARVEAWYLPAFGAPAKAPAVVFFHGNAELIDFCTDHVRGWRERGFAVLLPEYRGYGRSGGAPGQAGIVADATRFYDALAARPEIDASRIIIHGRSLGGGVACQLAARRPCAALVLESSFKSVSGFAWSMGVPPFFVKHPFRNDRVLPTLDRPVLIMHGKDDDIIPPSHGRRLHELCPGSMHVELPGGHNDFPVDPRRYWAAIDAFLDQHHVKVGSAPPRQ